MSSFSLRIPDDLMEEAKNWLLKTVLVEYFSGNLLENRRAKPKNILRGLSTGGYRCRARNPGARSCGVF